MNQKTNSMQARPTVNNIVLASAIMLLLIGMLTAGISLQPPAALDSDAPAEVFSAGRAFEVFEELYDQGQPRPTGSAANAQVFQRLQARMQALGVQVESQETLSCRSYHGAYTGCARITNLLARLPGRESGKAVLIVAHYDGNGNGPAAADNTANAAALVEIARAMLVMGPARNPVIFLFSDGEELTMLGAQAFVDEHPWAKEAGVVINLEARGTRGPSLVFETSADNAWLVDAYAAAVDSPTTGSLFYEAYKALPSDTDLSVFKKAGYPGLNFAFIDNSAYYHTPLDNLENLDLRSVQDQGASVLAVARRLAEMDLSSPPKGDAIFMDVLSLGVLRWPAGWNLPLVLLALALLGGAAWQLMRRGALSGRGLGWGALGGLAALVLPLLWGALLPWLLHLLRTEATPWLANPLWMRVAVWVGVAWLVCLCARLAARRAGSWGLGLGLGVWLIWALLAFALSLALPGATAPFLVPLLVSAVLLAVLAFTPLHASPIARNAVWLAILLVTLAVEMPLAVLMEWSLGFEMGAAIAFFVALAASPLLPLFDRPAVAEATEGQADRRKASLLPAAAVMGLAAVALVGLVGAMWTPAYSADYPQGLNLFYIENVDAGKALMLPSGAPEQLSAGLRALFKNQTALLFPWSTTPSLAVDAPLAGLSAPMLRIAADKSDEEGREVTLILSSPRGAEQIQLAISIENLAAVTVGGETFLANAADAWNGLYYLVCHGPACQGLEVTLQFTRPGPVSVYLFDYSHNLPPGFDAFIQARTPAITIYEGDQTILWRKYDF